MRNFIIHGFLFFLPILIFLSLLEYSVKDNPKKAKSDFIKSHKDSVEVLILGPSTMACAINPAFIDRTTASLSIAGNTIPIDYQIFKNFMNELPSLKIVLFDLSNGYLEYLDPSFNNSGSLLIHYDLVENSTHKAIKDYFVTTANFKYAINKTYNKYFKGDKKVFNKWGFITALNETSYSFKTLNYDAKKIRNSKAVAKIFNLHNKSNDIAYKNNTLILYKLVNLCKKKNIKICFISTPKYEYYNEVENNYTERRKIFLDNVVDNKQVFFLDHSNLKNSDPKLFHDILHLNYRGSMEYTKIINELITNHIK